MLKNKRSASAVVSRPWCEAMFTFHSHSRSLIFDVNEVRIWPLVTGCATEVHFRGSSAVPRADSDPNLIQTKMWADAQRVGRPANRWRKRGENVP